jgi:hypothetical protein
MEETFREKIAHAMIGHSMEEITAALIRALGTVLAEADPAVKHQLIEEACANVAHIALTGK